MTIFRYPWYNLPATVHKILFHGVEIVESAVLAIGPQSKAQECRTIDTPRNVLQKLPYVIHVIWSHRILLLLVEAHSALQLII